MSATRTVEKKGLASICSCITSFFKKPAPKPNPAFDALLSEYTETGVNIEMNPLPVTPRR